MSFDRRRHAISRHNGVRYGLVVGLLLVLAGLLPSSALANTAPTCYGNADYPLEIPQDSGAVRMYASCWDADGGALTYRIASEPSNGTLSEIKTDAGGASYVEYTPNAGWSGTDSFTYTGSDGTDTSEPATAVIKVVPPQRPNCSAPQDVTMRSNKEKSFSLSCSGDSNAGNVTYKVTNEPDHGRVTFSSWSPNTVVYTPTTDFEGTDSFSYTASNDVGTSDEVTQTIAVKADYNTVPSCYPLYETPALRAGASKTLALNCYDADGDPLTFATVDGSGPSIGSLSAITQPTSSSSGASVAYTSNGTEGADQFKFTANDGFGTSPAATQTLEVKPADYNTRPTCYQSTWTNEVEAGSTGWAFPSCQDAEDDPLTYKITTQPEHGTATEKSSTQGSSTYQYFEYKPEAGYEGADSLSYIANDGREDSSASKANFKVIPPKAPTCYTQQSATPVRTNTTKSFFVNCSSSLSGGPVTYDITQPAHGKVTQSQYSGGGSFVYSPDSGYTGPDSVAFKAKNSVGSTDGTYSFAVSNDANDKPQCWTGGELHLRNTDTKKLHLGCHDADGDKLTFRVTDQPDSGKLSVPAANVSSPGSTYGSATATYTPNADFVGTDSFTYVANDGRADSTGSTQSLDVHEAAWNTAPTCQSMGEQEVEKGANAWFSPLCHDEQGDKVTYEIVDPPAHGTLTQHTSTWGDSSYVSWEYKPAAGYEGTTDSFSFVAKDALASSEKTTVSIKLVPAKPPACTPREAIGMRSDGAKSLWLSCWGSPGGGTVTFEITKQPAHGNLSFPWGANSGSVIYTPEAGFEGEDSFSYRATNSAGASDAVTQILNVSKGYNTVPQCWSGAALKVRTGSAEAAEMHCWDAETDPLTYSIVGQPASGSLGSVVQPPAGSPFSPGRVTYTPSAEIGQDEFTYKANDGRADSDTVSFGLEVLAADYNSVPSCSEWPIQLRVAQNASLQLDEHQLPCWDEEGDALTPVVTTAPAHGKLSEPDGNGIRTYTPNSDYTGADLIVLKASDGIGTSTNGTRLEITITEPSQITTGPIQTPSGEPVRVQNYVDPDTGESFITVPSGDVGQFENGCMPMTLSTEINPGTGSVSNVELVLTPKDGSPAKDFAMTGGDPAAKSTWSATIDCIETGDLTIEYDLTDGDAFEHVVIPLGGIVLIDPQGVVHDKALYDEAIAAGKAPAEARAAAAIEGASAVLERNVGGAWKKVPASSPSISPNVNPQVTTSNGLFQWDVAEGTYRVVVSKEGYKTVTSRSVNIPPPVLDLHIAMEKVVTSTPAPETPTPDTPTPDTSTPDTSTPDTSTPNAETNPNTGVAQPGDQTASTPATGTTGAAGQPGATVPKPPCFGLIGLPRATCQANAALKKATAKCSKLKGKKKTACIKQARLAHKRTVATAKCQSLKGAKKAACIKKAKNIK